MIKAWATQLIEYFQFDGSNEAAITSIRNAFLAPSGFTVTTVNVVSGASFDWELRDAMSNLYGTSTINVTDWVSANDNQVTDADFRASCAQFPGA